IASLREASVGRTGATREGSLITCESSAAPGIAAGGAQIASLLVYHAGAAAFRALGYRPDDIRRWRRACHSRGSGETVEESDFDHVPLDHIADRREQGGHVAALVPLTAARIENRLELLDDEGDVPAAPENGTDHPGERHRPGIVLH